MIIILFYNLSVNQFGSKVSIDNSSKNCIVKMYYKKLQSLNHFQWFFIHYFHKNKLQILDHTSAKHQYRHF